MVKIERTCYAASALFVVSVLFSVIFHVRERKQFNFDYQKWKALDTDYIQEEFAFQRSHRGIEMMIGIANTAGWFVLCIPIIYFAWQSTDKGQSVQPSHIAVAVLALAGSFSELLSRTIYFGSAGTADWMSESFNLQSWANEDDQLGWRTVAVVRRIFHGTLLWIDALEFLFLGAILLCLPRRRTGIITSVLCLLVFLSEVLRFRWWRFFSFTGVLGSAIVKAILLPTWLVGMCREVKKEQTVTETDTTLELSTAHPAMT